MLNVKDLHVSIGENEILKGISIKINPGEVHAIMGPNGSGKSTFSHVMAGNPLYKVNSGEILFRGKDLQELKPHKRARAGLFLGFQYPVEIPGITNIYFLKNALNSIREANGLQTLDAYEFNEYLNEKMEAVGMGKELTKRAVNSGFSGGEKKKNEILQLLVLNPKMAILDETDSGLDIDALKTVAGGVEQFRRKDNAVILVTHYQRLLDFIHPDFVHVLIDGKIVLSGDSKLALELESRGYNWVREENGVDKP
ncbi:MAG: Fe-S cluster assembly ATPase SufC [Spirochaetaceae bacterium]|jgi:Fe-S cluster assembly ATP-binding protein|nr:Fe-S cluster assembly ATPase SufC [Spirochaetaceae bacterium]